MARSQLILKIGQDRCPSLFPLWSLQSKKKVERNRFEPSTSAQFVTLQSEKRQSAYLFASQAFNVALRLYGKLSNHACPICVLGGRIVVASLIRFPGILAIVQLNLRIVVMPRSEPQRDHCHSVPSQCINRGRKFGWFLQKAVDFSKFPSFLFLTSKLERQTAIL